MIEIAKFLSQYSIWIYLGLLAIFISGIRNFLTIRSEKRDLVFGLEKEISQRRINRTIALITLVVLLIVGEFILATFLVPALPSATQLQTMTIDPLIDQQFLQSQNLQGSDISVQSTFVFNSGNCIPGQVIITEPLSGQVISGEVGIKGTADIPNFGFYKYEYNTGGDQNWTTILAGRSPIIDGDLGNWDVTELTLGDYQLRLVVFDNINTEYPPCTITVKVSN